MRTLFRGLLFAAALSLASTGTQAASAYDRVLARYSLTSPQAVWDGMPDMGFGPVQVEAQFLMEARPLPGSDYAFVVVRDDPLTRATYKIGGYVYELSELADYYFYEACCFASAHNLPPTVELLLENARWAATSDRPSFVVTLDGAYFLHDEGPNLYYGLLGTMQLTDLRNPDAVPEPATWAMLVAGFGAIGSALRRRKSLYVHRRLLAGEGNV